MNYPVCTGKYDSFGSILYVGDKVVMLAAGSMWNGDIKEIVQKNSITEDGTNFGIYGWHTRGIDGIKKKIPIGSEVPFKIKKVDGFYPMSETINIDYDYKCDGNTTSVIIESGKIGTAACKPEDEFDLEIGRKIALKRAIIKQLESDIEELSVSAKPNKKYILNTQIKELETKVKEMKKEAAKL